MKSKSLLILSAVFLFACQAKFETHSRQNNQTNKPDLHFDDDVLDHILDGDQGSNSMDFARSEKGDAGSDLDADDAAGYRDLSADLTDASQVSPDLTFAQKIKAELAIDLESQKTLGTQNYSSGQNPPIQAAQNGQIIKDKIIYAGVGEDCGIDVNNLDDIRIENITIFHANKGICIENSDNVFIKNVRLINLAAPNTGPHCVRQGNELKPEECWGTRNSSADKRLGIFLNKSNNTTIEDVYTAQASSGIYAFSSPNTHISKIRCFDSRGPFPRGQCVQFNNSNDSSVSTFYAKAYLDQSHSEDTFNAYESDRIKFESGLIDGNYSINGVGLIADSGSDDVVVHDVDIIHTSVSGVSVYANKTKGKNFKASKIRVKDTQCYSRKGASPSSGGLILAAQPGTPNFSFDDIIFFNHCRQTTVWCKSGSTCGGIQQGGSMTNIREQDFKTRWTNE